MQLFEHLTTLLTNNHIKPSIPRIRILECLTHCGGHPTADEVYREIQSNQQRISKATVYNTLALFAEKGLVRVLTMENNEHRYDLKTSSHGHFICTSCGAISDFAIDIEGLQIQGIGGCRIDQKDIYFKGVCNKCLSLK